MATTISTPPSTPKVPDPVCGMTIGERVVAAGPEDKQKMILATSVQVAAALPAAPASK